jgi:hypothetical protein
MSFVVATLYRSGPDAVIIHVFQSLKPNGRVQWRKMFIDDLFMLDGTTLMKPLRDALGIRSLEDKVEFFRNMGLANDMSKYLQEVAAVADVSTKAVPMMESLLHLEMNLWMYRLKEGVSRMVEPYGTEKARKEATKVLRETKADCAWWR